MMTIEEIRDHADQLQGRLEAERKKIERGAYNGSPHANLTLVSALEGRIRELLDQCDALEQATAQKAVAVLVPAV